MAETLTITIDNKLSEIEKVSRVFSEFIQDRRLNSKLGFEISLALDEILTNVITHGYDDGIEGRIDVRGIFSEQEILIEVIDEGIPFNPLESDQPDLTGSIDERQIGGLGLHLVKNMMDRISYQRLDGKNVLIMNKNIDQ